MLYLFEIAVPLLSLLSEYLRFLVKWPLHCHFVTLYEVQSANAASVPAHCEEIIPNLLSDPIALLIKYTLMAPLRMDIGNIQNTPTKFETYLIYHNFFIQFPFQFISLASSKLCTIYYTFKSS